MIVNYYYDDCHLSIQNKLPKLINIGFNFWLLLICLGMANFAKLLVSAVLLISPIYKFNMKNVFLPSLLFLSCICILFFQSDVFLPCGVTSNILLFLQAGFLARLVGSDVAVASAHSSLKSMSGNSPSLELAARHCFLLEDPPDKKEPTSSERYVTFYGSYTFFLFNFPT